MSKAVAIGIDLGTSGARAVAVGVDGGVRAKAEVGFARPSDRRAPKCLMSAVERLLSEVARACPMGRAVIAVAGTSGSLVPFGADGVAGAISLYADQASQAAAAQVRQTAPSDAPVHGATSAVARALDLVGLGAVRFAFEPDFVAGELAGDPVAADANSALKAGGDPVALHWPAWVGSLGVSAALPEIVEPGRPLAGIDPARARALGLPPDCQVVAGTTDGCAAVLAAGVRDLGDAVTSLGSTLVVKMLVDRPVTDPQRGVYSHRLMGRWLVGGASNAGGAVLRHFFTDAQMQALSARIDPTHKTGLRYVPLLSSGERFPMADPYMMPCFAPRPDDDAVFYLGLLEALMRHEIKAYRAMEDLTGIRPRYVYTSGGGTRNPGWMAVRAARLGVPTSAATETEPAYGAARLALGAFTPA